MRVICKGKFPVYFVNQIQKIFETDYINPNGFSFKFEDKELSFYFDKDFTNDSLIPTKDDIYIGDGKNLLENKYANTAKFSISINGPCSYYDMAWPIQNAGDWFRIIILILARFYGDTDIEFSKRLYDFCEETLKMNSRFFTKFDEAKYNHYKNAYIFFKDYLNSFIEY